MRNAFFDTLYELASKDPRINLIVGDLGYSVVEKFAEHLPGQFLNAGVAEQNMTGIAAGMALSGKIVFTYSIANFPTLRCLEQIRNDVCYHKADVKIVSVGAGFAYGSLGASHQATEDIAVMRVLPEMTVIAPADPIETVLATKALADLQGPCYLRLGKAGEAILHTVTIEFAIGRAVTVRKGGDVCLISTGSMLKPCIEAAEKMEHEGISVRILSMHTIKPLDTEAVLKAAYETKGIVTVEEHSIIGGLGGAVAEVLAGEKAPRAALRMIGMNNSFCRKVGSQEYLRQEYGLSAAHIIAQAKNLIDYSGEIRKKG